VEPYDGIFTKHELFSIFRRMAGRKIIIKPKHKNDQKHNAYLDIVCSPPCIAINNTREKRVKNLSGTKLQN